MNKDKYIMEITSLMNKLSSKIYDMGIDLTDEDKDERIAELEQELIDQADQHAKILAPILNPKYRHQGCAIAQRACSSGCPYWGEFADTFVTSKAPKP